MTDANFRKLNGGGEQYLTKADRAAKAGLIAQAAAIVRYWKREMVSHKGGFTSGRFVTGTALNAITQTAPRALAKLGEYFILVGTNLRYHLFWELGHMNTWTGKYERVETLRPAVEKSMAEGRAAFVRAFEAVLKA